MVDKILALLVILYAIAQTEERFLEIIKQIWAKISIPNFTLYVAMAISMAVAYFGNLTILSYLGIVGVVPEWADHLMAGALLGSGSGFLNSLISFFRGLKLPVSSNPK